MNFEITETTIFRLSIYLRYITKMKNRGIIEISSQDIASAVGVKPAQIRKDLAYFGRFGTKGVGYDVYELHHSIVKILGLNKNWSVSLVGCESLGLALSRYSGFRERGFYINSIFDCDPKKVGRMIQGIEVMPIEKLEKISKQNRTQIGIISDPKFATQTIADSLIRSGVQGIICFTPVALTVPAEIKLQIIDLAANLELLAYLVQYK